MTFNLEEFNGKRSGDITVCNGCVKSLQAESDGA